MITVTQELEARGLFKQVGIKTTTPVPFRQSVEAYVDPSTPAMASPRPHGRAGGARI